MENLLIALNEGLIDRANLLLKKFKYLNLDKDDVLILLKIVEYGSNITYSKALKVLEMSKNDLETFLTKMIKQNYLKVKMKSDEKSIMEFDLTQLWVKLLTSIIEPTEESEQSIKLQWFITRLNILETTSIKTTVNSWLEDDGFKRMKSIVFNLYKLGVKNLEFHTIEKLYKQETNKKELEFKKLKEIAEHNWLID